VKGPDDGHFCSKEGRGEKLNELSDDVSFMLCSYWSKKAACREVVDLPG
jgi:hypothetical protein